MRKPIMDLEVTSPFDSSTFFTPKTIEELRAEQGVSAVTDVDALSGLIPDEELGEFITDVYRDRDA